MPTESKEPRFVWCSDRFYHFRRANGTLPGWARYPFFEYHKIGKSRYAMHVRNPRGLYTQFGVVYKEGKEWVYEYGQQVIGRCNWRKGAVAKLFMHHLDRVGDEYIGDA